jgi:outer membrane lipoprotein SlyB
MVIMKRFGLWALALLLAGCASSSPDVIQRGDAQRLSTVVDAVVLSVRTVTVEGSQSGVGAAAGGAVGGIAGYSSGGSQAQSQIAGILGAAAGAVAGNVIERAGTREEAVEILVQLKSGERRAVVQAKGEEVFQPGDAVLLITSSGKVRVVKAPKQ